MTSEEKVIGFSNVDQTSDPQSFMRYLETASANESIQARKRRTFELLAVQAGHRLLDVGCGLGDDVRALAQLVGPTGQVIGIDNTPSKRRSKSICASNQQRPAKVASSASDKCTTLSIGCGSMRSVSSMM